MIAGPAVVDASTVVEYLVTLRYADAATRVFRDAVEGSWPLWAPDLVFAEILSALRRLARTGAVTPREATRAADFVVRLPIRVTGTRELVDDIWNLRADFGAYDACYVSLARRLGAPLVTADRRLAKQMAARKWDFVSLVDG